MSPRRRTPDYAADDMGDFMAAHNSARNRVLARLERARQQAARVPTITAESTTERRTRLARELAVLRTQLRSTERQRGREATAARMRADVEALADELRTLNNEIASRGATKEDRPRGWFARLVHFFRSW